MGALQIPIGTYHRSISGKEGSIVINQSIRKKDFDPDKEFLPKSLFFGYMKTIKQKELNSAYWK